MSNVRNLSTQRILVVGGSGVLGGEIARVLADQGASVALAGRDQRRLNQRSESLGGVPTFQFDIRSPDQTSKMVDNALASLGGLDGLVNAAGVVAFGPLVDISDAAMDELLAANLTGPLRMIRAALPHLNDGFVVNITGVVAEQPVAGLTVYSAAKSGLSAASTALTRELRREGVTVLDARPPHTETGLANRPIEGDAPRMPQGLEPAAVARTIVEGVRQGVRRLESSDFS